MKKITLFLTLIYCTLSIAQQVDIVNRPPDNVTSIISTQGNDGSGVYSADTFTTNEAFALSSVSFYGTNSNGASIIDYIAGLNLIIYADNGGSPGAGFHPQVDETGIFEFRNISSDYYVINEDDNTSSFTIDLSSINVGEAPVLAPGTYWMVFYPSVNTPTDDNGRWNWYLSDSIASFEAHLIDPQNLFNMGATNWSSVNTIIGQVATSFAWKMTGVAALGVNDNIFDQISIYPNPANEFINVKIPSHVQVANTNLYNILGKKVNANLVNGQMDISNLSKGLYILKIESNSGTFTQKLIIQ